MSHRLAKPCSEVLSDLILVISRHDCLRVSIVERYRNVQAFSNPIIFPYLINNPERIPTVATTNQRLLRLFFVWSVSDDFGRGGNLTLTRFFTEMCFSVVYGGNLPARMRLSSLKINSGIINTRTWAEWDRQNVPSRAIHRSSQVGEHIKWEFSSPMTSWKYIRWATNKKNP